MESSIPSSPTLDSIELTSVAGVTVATTLIVSVITRAFGHRTIFRRVPIFVYVTAVAMLLTVIANRLLGTLPGSLGGLLWATAKAALASSGFYTWIRGKAGANAVAQQGAARPADGQTTSMLLFACLLLTALTGCVSRAELVTLREGMDRATTTIRRQHQEWATMLAEGRRSELPSLSEVDLRAVQIAHREYESLVAASRKADAPNTIVHP